MTDYDDRLELAPGERLSATVEQELAEALRAAYRPEPLAPERQRALLELALEDPLAPPSAEEIRESERLRRALDEGDDSHPDALLARALRAALSPPAVHPPAEGRSRSLVTPRAAQARGRGNVVYASFGVLALAAAAGFALLLTRPATQEHAAASARPALAQSRTTGTLFETPFEPGETTARIDRIALSRGRELRENRYAQWGVR